MSPDDKLIAYGQGSLTGRDLFSALKMYSGPDYSKKTYIEGFTVDESMDGVYGNPYFVEGENPFLDVDNWNYKGYGIGDIIFSPSGDRMYAVGDYTVGQSGRVVAKVYYGENFSKGLNIDLFAATWAYSGSLVYNPAENYIRVSGSYSDFNSTWDEILGEYLTRHSIGFSLNILLERPISK